MKAGTFAVRESGKLVLWTAKVEVAPNMRRRMPRGPRTSSSVKAPSGSESATPGSQARGLLTRCAGLSGRSLVQGRFAGSRGPHQRTGGRGFSPTKGAMA
jgi:hypothetical protein